MVRKIILKDMGLIPTTPNVSVPIKLSLSKALDPYSLQGYHKCLSMHSEHSANMPTVHTVSEGYVKKVTPNYSAQNGDRSATPKFQMQFHRLHHLWTQKRDV